MLAGRVGTPAGPVTEVERYLLVNYQHLLRPEDRMVARSLVAANFDIHAIPKSVWNRVWTAFPGIDRRNPWQLPIDICIRLLQNHKRDIHIPEELRKSGRRGHNERAS